MKLKTKKLEKKITTKEKNISAIISLGIMAVAIALYLVITYINAYKDADLRHTISHVQEGYVLLPSGILVTEDSVDMYIVSALKSDELSKREKKEYVKYLDLQDIDSSKYVAYLNGDSNALNDNSYIDENVGNGEKYEDLLVSNNTISEDKNELKMLNGKKAVSYKNLHEAEQGFGMNLGLYHYCDTLENYEMINAYTVGDEFLQCVYAINLDGTAIQDGQDVETSEIKTITVKLSTKLDIEDMISVYKDYDSIYEETLDETSIIYEGLGGTIVNLIYCERLDGRKYAIHCAEGIELEVAQKLMFELFSNLNYYN